ncbi:substrate-binding periplasmic protein [Thalassotalea sediminis]|uniref:substrate-binding periplasmic protein n=1 Tax=Thalassotalea sediminis TaxID=1759089 RepID=UPI0025735A75|nr:transporter substrate-binding domain-containing protein [Thalassotalea sediminis]
MRIGVVCTLLYLTCFPAFSNLFGTVSPTECKVPLKLSLTSDWYPYVTTTLNNESTGIDVELLKRTLSLMGCQLRIEHFPERRALFQLSWGHFDIALGASKTKEREKDFHYSNPYRFEHNRFAYRASDHSVENITNLNALIAHNKIIGINLAGWYGEAIEHAKRDYNGFVFSETAVKRLKMLTLNRIDVVVDDDVVLCSEIEKAHFQTLAVHPLLLHEASIHFIFNKKTVSTRFVKQFNSALKEIIDAGELESLFSLYVAPGCLPNSQR